jgi:hypothetical protein
MQDLPTAAELVEAVREYLEQEVHAGSEGRARYHARVAINVLAIVRRELELGSAADAAERARLLGLLPEADSERSLVELNRELAAKIRDGAFAGERAALVAHLRATLSDKLAIANPRHLA